jgi:type VII secretion-associated serine protease mycosin
MLTALMPSGSKLTARLMAARRPARRYRWVARLTVAALAAAMPTALLGVGTARADVVRSTESWVLAELNLPAAWSVSKGQGVVVAVIDSGVNPAVSDLAGRVRTGPDFSGVSTPPSDPTWGAHGTWMASLIAGHGHAGGASGIIGSAPHSTVLSIRVITDASDPNNAKYTRQSASRGQRELADAITYAVDHGAQVISMSLGYSLQSRSVRAALQHAYDHNVVVVASAGNSGNAAGAAGRAQAPYSFPADYPGVLAVGAVNSSGRVSSFSSENLSVQVAAPGARVPAQGRDGGYWYVSGTSPACALTAGVVALIKAKYPRLSGTQVISAITSSTMRSTRPRGGWDEQIGFGVVDAAAALTAAGRLAAGSPPGPGVAAAAHFGGGPAAVPPVPVAPRGSTGLVLYCFLAAACLGLVALATSKLLAVSDPSPSDPPTAEAATMPGTGPGRNGAAGTLPASPGPAAARHAAPRGRGHHPAEP